MADVENLIDYVVVQGSVQFTLSQEVKGHLFAGYELLGTPFIYKGEPAQAMVLYEHKRREVPVYPWGHETHLPDAADLPKALSQQKNMPSEQEDWVQAAIARSETPA